jgi:RNA polymerase sigma-70 factor (ECF subfamily)
MTDAELVVRAVAGDAGAFADLVARHHAACLRYAAHLLGDRMEAEDVVQETLLRAYRSLGRYQERQQFRPWLFRILVNRCRTAATRKGAQRLRTAAELDPDRLTTHDGSAALELRSQLAEALAGLDEPHREAFLLKLGEGLEYEEIARITGASVSALKMRVKRARDRVRARWKELDDVERG